MSHVVQLLKFVFVCVEFLCANGMVLLMFGFLFVDPELAGE